MYLDRNNILQMFSKVDLSSQTTCITGNIMMQNCARLVGLAYKQGILTPLIIFIFIKLMESVDSLPQTYNTYNTSPKIFVHLSQPSPVKHEREVYIRKIEQLMISNKALEEKKENLQGTVYDLKNLLTFVGKEGAEECQYLHSRNEELKKKALRLQNALKYSHKSGLHLQRCASFWNQFVQQ